MKITICGGGSLGHVCLGVLASQKENEVRLLTRQPEIWANTVCITDCEGKVYEGNIKAISSSPADVIPDADIVFICLPGFAIKSELEKIKPYLNANTLVGTIVSSTGFFFFAHEALGQNAKLFGFQRTPFIARTKEYGHSANLLGYKPQVAVAHENIADVELFRQKVERLWLTPTKLLDSFYEASLTNSNPILHTGRLYSMWKDWNGQIYDHISLFYREWTEDAAQTLINMDAEFMRLLDELPVTKGSIPSLLEYYESHDARSLCTKLQSIAAFQNITSPMKEVDGGWIPDFESRYFTEDFPFGLRFIKQIADEKGISTPTIDKVYEWGMSKCNNNK